MKLLVLRSVNQGHAKDAFSVCMNTTYAEKVLGHLSDKGQFCSACGKECVQCRRQYDLDFSQDIVGVLTFPAVLPAIVEKPQEFLPPSVPDHDVLLALAVNEEILAAFVERFAIGKGIVIPIEAGEWISPHGVATITTLCNAKGIEVAFPKPFCSFDPPQGSVLGEFRKAFRIGKPQIEFSVRDGVIAETTAVCSAPCGATYYMARWLKGARVDENLTHVVEKLLSCYPCTAGHTIDPEFKDSIMHQACKIQKRIVDCESLSRVA